MCPDPRRCRAAAPSPSAGLTIKSPDTGGWKMPLKEHREKRQEEKLKRPETRPRQRAGSLPPARWTLSLPLKVWGRWAAVHGDAYRSRSGTRVE